MRNYMKRVLRHLFRLSNNQWHSYDVVLLARKPFDRTDFTIVSYEFSQLTKCLYAK